MTETVVLYRFNLDLINSNFPIAEESCSRMMCCFLGVFGFGFFKKWKSWLLVYKKGLVLFVD